MNLRLPVTEDIASRSRDLTLNSAERSRYSRHLLLPEVGEEGQLALKAARVLIVGAGGLGSPVAYYLAAAGVGQIGLLDFDEVDTTNLQRQILYSELDKGSAKATTGASRLSALNSHIQVDPLKTRFSPENASELFARYDVIVDGTDNFATRYLVNDAAVLLKKPVVYGSIFRFDGQASLFYAPHGPCYRCLFPNPPPPEHVPNCAEGGVLGVVPGIIGVIQATEAIKLITGIGTTLLGRLLTYDATTMKYAEFSFKKDPSCAVCGEAPTIRAVAEASAACGIAGEIGAVAAVREITTDDYIRLRNSGELYVLIDVRSVQERQICTIPEAVHIPLAEIAGRLREIPRQGMVVLHCKSGQRSRSAAAILLKEGYQNVASLRGGIIAWIDETGASMAKY